MSYLPRCETCKHLCRVEWQGEPPLLCYRLTQDTTDGPLQFRPPSPDFGCVLHSPHVIDPPPPHEQEEA